MSVRLPAQEASISACVLRTVLLVTGGSVTISSNPGLEFRRAGSFFDEGCNCWLVGFGNCWLVGGWGCWLVRIRSCWLVSLGGESRDSSDTMRIAPCRRVFQEFNPKGEPG
mgnify:CR=1 FL=1